MSLASGSARKRSRHQWRGVVEDFVDLNLNEHSYHCILKHTANLRKKLQRKHNADEMARKGVIPALVAILGHSSLQPRTTLQRTALRVLEEICDERKDTNHCGLLVQAGALPHLLTLLKLQPKVLAPVIIILLNRIMNLEIEIAIPSQQEYIQALIGGIPYTEPMVKVLALRLIEEAVVENAPSAEETALYVTQLNILLRDENPTVVRATLELYNEMAFAGSEDVIVAIRHTGCVTLLNNILHTPQKDPLFVRESAAELISHLKVTPHNRD